ncbi:hypothetical protein ACFE04_020120 [Oxalis oulophora]
MDFLICDEVWPSGPLTPDHDHFYSHQEVDNFNVDSFVSNTNNPTKQEYEHVFNMFVAKESSYMPSAGYFRRLQSQNLVVTRFKAIQWFIKTRSRLSLSMETVFYAANYLDRFLSTNDCNVPRNWMIELLSIACISVASKFSETCAPSLPEIQMEGLDHTFKSSKITEMEIILLKALDWRLIPTTSYSYLELLPWKIDHDPFTPTKCVTDLLIEALLDIKCVEYRPSVIAVSALWCSLEASMTSLTSSIDLSYITDLIEHDQKENLEKCHDIMLAVGTASIDLCPSSPMSVLFSDQHGSSGNNIVPSKKRKRGSTETSNN